MIFWKSFIFFTLAGCTLLTSANATQTIVLMRHGEKPEDGRGQLTCQGLNRSLALPKVLFSKFGKPAAIFAPNPSVMKVDHGKSFHYVRPLATIEPTAIQAELPVNVAWGLEDIRSLEHELLAPKYENATIFVAWEHRLMDVLARKLMSRFGGDPAQVPRSGSDDFDIMYVITISHDQSQKHSVSFKVDSQGLNGLPATCPQ